MKTLNLRTKIFAVTTGIVVVMGVFITIFIYTATYQKLFNKLQDRGIFMARHTAEMSVNPILTERFYELQMIINDLKSSEKDIVYIFALDQHGDILAHTFNGGFPVDLKTANTAATGQAYRIQPLKAGGGNILDIAVPVLKGEAGVIHVGVSEDYINKDINEITGFMVLIITSIMSAGIIMAVVLSGAITKPILRLTDAVKAAGSGDLGHIVSVRTNDEIGQLSGSFNKMTNELKKRTDELRRINEELTVLQVISATVSGTMKLEDIFTEVLDALVNYDILKVAQKGAIFMIDGERLNLVSQTGFTEDFEDAHKGLKVGECICGLAARTGRITVCENPETDNRHIIKYHWASPLGHISVPLIARSRTLGILCFCSAAGFKPGEREMALFYTIGSRIGAAIDNVILYEKTKELSLHDPLTGLANRRLMDYVVETSFARARRAECPFSAIMLDVDYFKKYNDTYGHAYGDNILVDIARIVSTEIRQIDLGVRYGGEEFLVLLPETALTEACDVAERIRTEVEAKTSVTVSLGVSCYDHRMQNKEDVVNKADDALLRAKQNGRNRVEVASVI
ncbi:MAG: diguanylate cyclase [Nitrospirae bacterium]|nr:diguanylate cyclase [Nitrospirota bacterium]